MKGVVPNYLFFKERKAIYIFTTGAVVGREPRQGPPVRHFVRGSGAFSLLAGIKIATEQTMTSSAKACEAGNNVMRTIKKYVLGVSEVFVTLYSTPDM